MPFVYIVTTGSSDSDMVQSNVTSQIDGLSTSFTIPESIQSGSLRVFWNGVRQVLSDTYNETSATTFTTTFTPLSGDTLIIEYIPT